jgi:hypothetical protein
MSSPVRTQPELFKSAAAQAVTTTYAVFEISTNGAGQTSKIPTSLQLRSLAFRQSAEAGSPTSVTGYLCRDALGDEPITPEFTALLVDGPTAGKGGFAVAVDTPYVWDGTAGTKGKLYVRLKVNVATSITGQFLLTAEV